VALFDIGVVLVVLFLIVVVPDFVQVSVIIRACSCVPDWRVPGS
jgi:hypothetical protein